MVKVRALTRGYVGGVLREGGEVFDWPEGNKVGRWVQPVAFGGKGDHDGDGLTGGSAPADVAAPTAEPKKGGGKKGKAETIAAPTAEPFADAPEPDTVKGNGIQAALGGVQPDWIDPASGVAGGVPANDKPVMADE